MAACAAQVPLELFLRLSPELFLTRDVFRQILLDGGTGQLRLQPAQLVNGVFLDLGIVKRFAGRRSASRGASPLQSVQPVHNATNTSWPPPVSVCAAPQWMGACVALKGHLVSASLARRQELLGACVARERRRHRRVSASGANVRSPGRALGNAKGASIDGTDEIDPCASLRGQDAQNTEAAAEQAAELVVMHADAVQATVAERGCEALARQALRRLGSLSHVFFTDASKLSLNHLQQMAGFESPLRGARPRSNLHYVNRASRARGGLFDERQAAPYNTCSQHAYGVAFAALSAAAHHFEDLAEADAPSVRLDALLRKQHRVTRIQW